MPHNSETAGPARVLAVGIDIERDAVSSPNCNTDRAAEVPLSENYDGALAGEGGGQRWHDFAMSPRNWRQLGGVPSDDRTGQWTQELREFLGRRNQRTMKIAQVAPLMESVPPRLYGGSERIVSYLTEALVAEGHDVTLFASGDTFTNARLVSCCRQSLRLDSSVLDPIPHYMVMLDKLRQCASVFDIVHFHIDQFHFPIFRDISARTLTTLHGRQDLPDLHVLYRHFAEMPLVSISNAQRFPIPDISFAATVYHGLPHNLLPPSLHPQGGYLAFLGRIAPEKRVDRAIRIARAVGLPLKIAAKVDRVDRDYFNSEIAPLLNASDVQYIGEIDEQQKAQFLGDARGLLFPIEWPEPFGLVMIEAMACGTPVLAFRNGSVEEVVDHGETGYIVDGEEEAIGAMGALLELDRAAIRRQFEARFTSDRMARDYLRVYRALLEKAGHPFDDINANHVNGSIAVAP